MSYAVIILGSRPRGLARTDEDKLPVISFQGVLPPERERWE